jgi:hypothetical protein
MSINLPYWTIPAAIMAVGFVVTSCWPYKRAGDYGFNPMPLIAGFLWIIGSLAAWLIYFMVF